MRSYLLTAVLAGLTAAAFVAPAGAVDWTGDFTRARAYHHFMTSPYATREYSGQSSAGYEIVYRTPWEYRSEWVTPTWRRELITPRRHEVYQSVPTRGIYAERWPVLVPPEPVPAVAPVSPYELRTRPIR